MDTQWRPPSWANPYFPELQPFGEELLQLQSERQAIYEAGADAILGALKNDGITMRNYNPTSRTVIETAAFLNQRENGTLVFIPDEEIDEDC